MAMVVVTHEMGFARSTSDAVVFMDHGQVVESGTPEQIFDAAETDRLRRFLSQVLKHKRRMPAYWQRLTR